jgi:hypothetical protein
MTTGPKALLALDGGAIRGAFTLGVLGELESMLAKEMPSANNRFVLADYFDFIGGTSTGAITAVGLSLGWEVSRLKYLFKEFGPLIFRKHRFVPLRAWSKYAARPLLEELDRTFADRTLGSPELRTLLMIVMHNRATGWPSALSNIPSAIMDDSTTLINLKLRDLLFACCAPPGFFPSALHDIGGQDKISYEFVYQDGGITPFNNPALLLFLTSTLPEYKLEWPTGRDRLLLISIGTGLAPMSIDVRQRFRAIPSMSRAPTPLSWLLAASNHNDMVCRALGQLRFGPWIDSKLGYIQRGLADKLFTYVRYDADLSDEALAQYGVRVDSHELARLDAVEHADTLIELGAAYAEAHLNIDHFRGFIKFRPISEDSKTP